MNMIDLLKVLENHPALSNADLADVLNEEEETVAQTRKRLEQQHIICGYHTIINWDKTNEERVTAFIEVSAKPERDVGYDKIADKISRFDEVSSLYLLSGKSEFLVVLEGKSMREVGDFVAQKLAPIDGVTSTVTCFLLKKYKVEGVKLDEEELRDERALYTL